MQTETTKTRPSRKIRDGIVLSASGAKTIVVKVERRVPHGLYGKFYKQSKKFHAHDEEEKAQPGDRVRIMETRPISKTKRWRLVDVIGH